MGEAAARMEVMGNPTEVLPVAKEVQAEVDRAEGKSWPMGSIERFAFYEHAKRSFCVVQTRERRFYGCFKFKMGVIPPEAKLGA
jgi:L-fucose mutarotase